MNIILILSEVIDSLSDFLSPACLSQIVLLKTGTTLVQYKHKNVLFFHLSNFFTLNVMYRLCI